MARRPVQTIIPQTFHKRQKPGLTVDNDHVDEKNQMPKIIVLHTAAVVFQFQLDQPTGVQTHFCKVIALREVVLESKKKYGETHCW